MIQPSIIRTWIMRRPRPHMLRLHLADDVVQEMLRGEGQSWQDMADSIAALEPSVLEALGQDGKLLRAIKPNEDDGNGNRIRDNRSVPLPPALHSDPETARICFTADLLHRAYQHSTDVAFAKLVELFERSDARSAGIEARLERTERAYLRTLQDQVDDAFDRAEEAGQAAAAAAASGEGGIESMLTQAFVGGMASAPKPPPKANGKANGK